MEVKSITVRDTEHTLPPLQHMCVGTVQSTDKDKYSEKEGGFGSQRVYASRIGIHSTALGCNVMMS